MTPLDPTIATTIIATVRIRRGGGWRVKPEAELTDGNRYTFRFGWRITEEDSSIYIDETAWIPEPVPLSGKKSDWPMDAPAWIASGDLCDVETQQRAG